jgi:hypothetical protein
LVRDRQVSAVFDGDGGLMNSIRFGRWALLVATILASTSVRAAGGPDGFGYVWDANGDIGGPALEWIDISALGTPVAGLADDNSAAAIALPRPFRYYWTDLSQITIGSNGWVSLLPASNIASCFPIIPTAGGADAYLAPLMSDLIFTGAGNPGSVRTYYDAAADLFIISYLNVPYWQVAAPGYFGSNTFQVVLDYNNRSIRFNYQALTTPPATAGCVDQVIGIESPQGSFGLQAFLEAIPTVPATLRFTYPAVPLISVIDPSPNSLMNNESAAAIVETGTGPGVTLTANVENSGTDATTTATDVRAEVMLGSIGGLMLYDQTVSVPTLAANQQLPIGFVPDFLPLSGPQLLRVTVSGGGDINPGNNQLVSELYGLTPGAGNQVLSYTSATTNTGTVNWNGGSGMFSYGAAIFIDPPNDQYQVRRLGAFISNALGSDNYALELRDNDGPDGSPGTSLALIEVAAGSVVTGQWSDLDLPQPVQVDADGFYLVWYQRSGSIFLGAVQEASLSRRGLELLAGSFATYRSNSINELMLRVTLDDTRMFRDGFE